MPKPSEVLNVTGGGRGIDAATAGLAASRGYAVCVNYRENQSAAGSVVNEIVASGGQAIAVKADIGSEEQVVSLFQETERELGPVTALVNNPQGWRPGCVWNRWVPRASANFHYERHRRHVGRPRGSSANVAATRG